MGSESCRLFRYQLNFILLCCVWENRQRDSVNCSGRREGHYATLVNDRWMSCSNHDQIKSCYSFKLTFKAWQFENLTATAGCPLWSRYCGGKGSIPPYPRQKSTRFYVPFMPFWQLKSSWLLMTGAGLMCITVISQHCNFFHLYFRCSQLFSCHLSITGTLRHSNFHHSPLRFTPVFSLVSLGWTIQVPFIVLQILFYSFSLVYKLLMI